MVTDTPHAGSENGVFGVLWEIAQERRAILLGIREAMDSGNKDEVIRLAAKLVGRESRR